MACKSCQIFKVLDDLAQTYGKQVFDALAPGSLKLFSSFFGAWLLWQIIWKGAVKGEVKYEDILKPILTYSLITAFLASTVYWEWFYTPLYQTINSISNQALTAGSLELRVLINKRH